MCTNFHGQNAHDLQTNRLLAEETCGKKEMEKSLLGLAAKSEDRNAVTPSVLSIVTRKKGKAFLFHFEKNSKSFLKFLRLFWLIFSYPWDTCGKDLWDSSFLTLPHHREGEIKEPATIRCISNYQYHRSNAEDRSGAENESKCFR